jgi:hypothetical protein
MERLKKRWGIASNFQLLVILFVFSVAGSSLVWVRRPVFALLGVTPATPVWLKVAAWVGVLFPAYHVMLLVWGTLLGQFRFFWNFEKKMLRRLRLLPPA